MIRGLHGLLYSSDPEATRAFFRDLVRLPGSDVGTGWWIFDLPEGDLGVHPADGDTPPGTHDVSLYCDDIHGTVAHLAGRGVRFLQSVEDHGYGLVTHLEAPGGVRVQLYEPRYVKTTPRSAAARGKAASPAGKRSPRKKVGPRKAARKTAGKKAAPRKAPGKSGRAPGRKSSARAPARRGRSRSR